MDDTTRNGGFPTGSTGDVDPHGDIVGTLQKRAVRARDGGLWERWDPIAAEYGDTLEAVRLERERKAAR